MSIVLPNLALAGAVVGTRTLYDFQTIVQTGTTPQQIQTLGKPQLQFHNESPVGLLIELAQSGKKYNLPAGAWGKVEVDENDRAFYWTPLYILLTNPAVNLLLVTWLPPGDVGTDIVVLGNSPIQGAAVITNPQSIIDPATNVGVTVTDFGAGNAVVLDPTAQNRGFAAQSTDALGGTHDVIRSDVGSVNVQIGDSGVPSQTTVQGGFGTLGRVTGVHAVNASGYTGVAVVVAANVTTGITATTNQTIVNYAPVVSGMYRFNVDIRVNNGTPNQNIAVSTVYHALFKAASVTRIFTFNNGTTNNLLANGATAFGNDDFPCQPLSFYADSSQNITLVYRDPAGTPNDSVACYLEFLG